MPRKMKDRGWGSGGRLIQSRGRVTDRIVADAPPPLKSRGVRLSRTMHCSQGL